MKSTPPAPQSSSYRTDSARDSARSRQSANSSGAFQDCEKRSSRGKKITEERNKARATHVIMLRNECDIVIEVVQKLRIGEQLHASARRTISSQRDKHSQRRTARLPRLPHLISNVKTPLSAIFDNLLSAEPAKKSWLHRLLARCWQIAQLQNCTADSAADRAC